MTWKGKFTQSLSSILVALYPKTLLNLWLSAERKFSHLHKGGNEEEMKLNESYRVNSQDVVHETIDGEVVIVNLATGTYYSTSESGLDIWNGIDRGLAVEQMIEELARVYVEKPENIRKGIEKMIKRLSEEGLIVPLQGPMKGDTANWLSVEVGTQFRQPDIQKYTDMEDLLILDPIHEVGNGNWPQPKG
jgi:hypothetical protein